MIIFVKASPELAFATRSLIARDMAAKLSESRVDIRCPKSVSAQLSWAGFGIQSVSDDQLCAAAIIINFRITSLEVH